MLACAASNVAVDNLVERLAVAGGGKTPLVRVGHPARLLPQVGAAAAAEVPLRFSGLHVAGVVGHLTTDGAMTRSSRYR